jgi:rfaE bifunctional protein kinase chain/domain
MTVSEILEKITNTSALVVGDICLDRWCDYDPALADPSRETGIPRIAVVRTVCTPGAAGTVAGNLAALKAKKVAVLGLIGSDGFGVELQQALTERGISPEPVVRWNDLPTFTYTKLINKTNGVEDQPRVDFIQAEGVPVAAETPLIDQLRKYWDAYDVILVSDQAETEYGGVITSKMRTALAELAAAEPNKVVWADSRVRAEHFRNVILKSNREEAEAASKRAFQTVDFERLRAQTASPMLVMTDGPNGAIGLRNGEQLTVPTKPNAQPVDICGAGDSFSAGAALALAITGSAQEAFRFGNIVSSITIMKKGTGTASPAEVFAADRSWPV